MYLILSTVYGIIHLVVNIIFQEKVNIGQGYNSSDELNLGIWIYKGFAFQTDLTTACYIKVDKFIVIFPECVASFRISTRTWRSCKK